MLLFGKNNIVNNFLNEKLVNESFKIDQSFLISSKDADP